MKVLGIETSCDETAAAVVEDGRRVLADVVSTQIDVHRRWGGVIPELASRNHLVQVLPVVDEALTRANTQLADLDAIAVTSGPGLIGALLVGVQVAKSLALAVNKPLVAVNHLEGHLLAVLLEERAPTLPFLGLVVSGGHTSLYEVREDGYRLLGSTRDDAAGEAYDKVGKLLGLPYPAGREIDQLAQTGNREAIRFPRALPGQNLEFSFSGVKTAVLHHLQTHGMPQGQALADLCASFQEAICDVLSKKAIAAAKASGLEQLVLCGGVAANSRLRALTASRAQGAGLELFVPRPAFCTDNGAMIAAAGFFAMRRTGPRGQDIKANAAWRIG
ncbi:MAG: tRNA (adenosine(37)-N6)-threonylcarbamoyltransferase complex transferase subunit TsaD [Deltaproteobacteria bacterium]|nr:tRNA (adenosine(37)-N6)-threonylcarbamoyltransferase complex transferase subunit TsaD [Deltaproteobacteria bacterium]